MKYFIFLIKPQFQTLSLIIKAFHIIFIFRFQVIFSPTNMSIGLTGYLITGSLGSSGVSPLGYKDIDITGNTSYTYVKHTA